jgi:hypothetical protein
MMIVTLAHILECSRSIHGWRWREFAKRTKENSSTRRNRPVVGSIHPNIVSGAADIFGRGETLLSKVIQCRGFELD